MRCCSQNMTPGGAVFPRRAARNMDITLHIGPHRTATTGFQNYLRMSRNNLRAQGVEVWEPEVIRRKQESGCYKDADTRSRVKLVQASGADQLIISEENIAGSVRQNLKDGALYLGIGDRIARYTQALGGNLSAVLFSPRSLDVFWCSSLAFAAERGLRLPDPQKRAVIAQGRRGWRDVITEIAKAAPGASVRVLPFETYAGRPDRFLADGVDIEGPLCKDRAPVNVSPRLPELRRALRASGRDASTLPFGMGRWNPFTNEEHSALRELYADDMMWLAAGADGLATLIEDRSTTKAGLNPPRAALGKGQFDEFEERRMARPG